MDYGAGPETIHVMLATIAKPMPDLRKERKDLHANQTV
jgi:hypothetical protein